MCKINTGLFAVTCKCGHVGRGFYIPITFPVKAEDGKEAAAKARQYPRVKHDHKDAILNVVEITEEEYNQLLTDVRQDPYLKITNSSEQRNLDLADRLVPEIKEQEKKTRNKDYIEKKQRQNRRMNKYHLDEY